MFGATTFEARPPSLQRASSASHAAHEAADGTDTFPRTKDPKQSTRAADEGDMFELADEYGRDAAGRLAKILRELEAVGFAKAHANEWSAFDRVLSGIVWVLQQLVKREDEAQGRVHWDVLFQSHAKMKPRLGFAQEVVKRIEALPIACPVQIQPHQLLLQDFGDIGAVHRLVSWLIDQQQHAVPHLEGIRKHRRYQDVLGNQVEPNYIKKPPIVNPEVAYLQNAYRPRRKWQYLSEDWKQEPEDALIQRCLLEYGERVCIAALDEGKSASGGSVGNAIAAAGRTTEGGEPPMNLMAQLASQAAAAATAGPRQSDKQRSALSKRFVDPRAAEFDMQYQKAMKQAMAEQQILLQKQKEREIQLLQQVVSVPEIPESPDDGNALSRALSSSASHQIKSRSSEQIEKERSELHEQELQVQSLIDEKCALEASTNDARAQSDVLHETIASMELELHQLDVQESQTSSSQQHALATLRQFVTKNEVLKRQKNELRARCRTELDALQARIAHLKEQAVHDAANQDEETLRLNGIEQMHTQLAAKHKDMKVALAKQTREIQLKMRKIDEIPTRIELVQYEKRFLELYEEVALTLEETRKYYCTYNTLQTTQEFLEKEISLINSIHENFDVAMSSKTATQAFFMQLDGIIQNVQGTVAKQQSLRADHQANVETLDSKYQVLLEKERTYVNVIREFQRECEKNERLAAKLHSQGQPRHHQP
uniref:Uncharacterized protein n=1 Tax=Globisporangium ultimum (strain ATCC 200006 / CBS 805.95 / DAOM BR144) TaxID=431595 RepID=K3X990_GLOUD